MATTCTKDSCSGLQSSSGSRLTMIHGNRQEGEGQSRLQDCGLRTPYLMKVSPHLALSPSSLSHYLVTLAFLEVVKRHVLSPLFTWSWGASLVFVSSEFSSHLSPISEASLPATPPHRIPMSQFPAQPGSYLLPQLYLAPVHTGCVSLIPSFTLAPVLHFQMPPIHWFSK